MKVFAVLMLRCALVMLLSSLLQNGTLANLQKWEKSCREVVNTAIRNELKTSLLDLDHLKMYRAIQTFGLLLKRVNKFPIEGMDELLKRRLQEPLENAISKCEELKDKVKQSGLEKDKNDLESSLSEIRSFAQSIDKKLDTFMFEVQLVNWTSGNSIELGNKFYNFWTSSLIKQSDCENDSFRPVVIWISEHESPRSEQDVENLQTLIFEAKLSILEKELSKKIAEFTKQKKQINVDGFMGFSDEFKKEWKQIEHKMIDANIVDIKIANTEKTLRESLHELANRALEETVPLKKIITEKVDKLCPGPLKNVFKKLGQSFKSDQKKQKEAQINAKKVINEIRMFDGAAKKLLARFEHEELANTDFCAELEKAVEKDKQMVSKAYQVKDKELRRNVKIEVEK